MIYVLDSCTLIALFKHYFPGRFPSLWENFDALVSEHRIISVAEVKNELAGHGDRLSDWVSDHRELFPEPTSNEASFVNEIFRVRHFKTLIRLSQQQLGKPVADPFVIAKANFQEDGCVVTEEVKKPNAARIPNVCEHFDVPCLNLEAFMEHENWSF